MKNFNKAFSEPEASNCQKKGREARRKVFRSCSANFYDCFAIKLLNAKEKGEMGQLFRDGGNTLHEAKFNHNYV